MCCLHDEAHRLRRRLLKLVQYIVKFCKHRKHDEKLIRNNPWNRKTNIPTFHQGIQSECFFFFTHSLARRTICCLDARMRLLAGSPLSCSKTSSRANVDSMSSITEKIHIWKLPYQYQMPAQAVHEFALLQAHLNLQASRHLQQAELDAG